MKPRCSILAVLFFLATHPTAWSQSGIASGELGSTPFVSQFGDWLFAGQPEPSDLRLAAERGYTHVLTLREPKEIEWDEAAAVKAAGMEFLQIPIAGAADFNAENLDAICAALEKLDGQPVVFHCRTASRVAAAWMAFRVTRRNVPVEQAAAEATAIGLKNPQLIEAVHAYLAARQDSTPANQQPLPADINKDFLDPNLDPQRWIDRFELESREIFAARDEIVRACQIAPETRIADIGAGTGLFTRLFAAETGPRGWVYAVEISPAFVRHIRAQLDHEQIQHVTPILSSQRHINLPPDSIEIAFVCDTYHHFEQVAEILASIHAALKPAGQLVVIDFERIPGQSRQWVLDHVRADKNAFRKEIENAGFEFVEEVKISKFAENYFLRFQKK